MPQPRRKKRNTELQIGDGNQHRPKEVRPHLAQEIRESGNHDPEVLRQMTFRLRSLAALSAQGYKA